MSDRYFSKFPNIYYNNVLCKDLVRRVRINANDDVQGDANLFYPFTITQHMRPDQVAEYYYKDSEMDWLIYHANKIIDPYYGWNLDQRQFESLIKDKYGSAEIAQRTILYYRNNWPTDANELTPEYYNNTLDLAWKKYYEPRWGMNNRVISYVRRPVDWTMNTNRIVSYPVTYTSNTSFQVGEPVDFINVTSTVGLGQVVSSNSSTLVVQSVSDDFVANNSITKTITGMVSGASATASAMTTLLTNIELDEEVFWSPVTAYDNEVEINEQKREIYLVGDGMAKAISFKVAEELTENMDKLTGLTTED